MPRLSQEQKAIAQGRVIFRDAGFQPVLRGDKIRLGPGQMALVGFGKYVRPEYDLGIQEDVVIPRSIPPVAAVFLPHGKNTVEATVTAPRQGSLRIVMQQRSTKDGSIMRSWKGGPPNGTNMGKVFVVTAFQDGKPLPVEINYDKIIWSGLSWAVGEIPHGALRMGVPVTIDISSAEEGAVQLEGHVYQVEY